MTGTGGDRDPDPWARERFLTLLLAIVSSSLAIIGVLFLTTCGVPTSSAGVASCSYPFTIPAEVALYLSGLCALAAVARPWAPDGASKETVQAGRVVALVLAFAITIALVVVLESAV